MKTIFSLNPIPLAAIGFLYLAGQTVQVGPESGLLSVYESGKKPVALTTADSSQLYLPNDLEATLWAEAPLFYNPTNMDIDAKGRVWITEAVNYRKFNNKPEGRLDHPEGERVMILEDTNGDGKADESKVYVQGPRPGIAPRHCRYW